MHWRPLVSSVSAPMLRRHFRCIVVLLLLVLILHVSPIRFFTEDFVAELQREIAPADRFSIPRRLWQTWPPSPSSSSSPSSSDADAPPRVVPLAVQAAVWSWHRHNPDYDYQLLSDRALPALLPALPAPLRAQVSALRAAPQLRGLRARLLPYLALHARGGVAADARTSALRPVDAWMPAAQRGRARLVVGVCYDQRRERGVRAGYAHPVQFCPWALAAARGHVAARRVLAQALAGLADMARSQRVPLAAVRVADADVERLAGGAALSAVVFRSLAAAAQAAGDGPLTFANLSGLAAPRRFGEVLVLPVNAFGSGQNHSGSAHDEREALVRYHFDESD